MEALELTRQHHPDIADIPVVAVTAFAMKGDEEKFLKGGCTAYLAKSISVGLFIETVKGFLE